jgi:hypothetical protein
MYPPIVLLLTNPSAHKTNSITEIAHTISANRTAVEIVGLADHRKAKQVHPITINIPAFTYIQRGSFQVHTGYRLFRNHLTRLVTSITVPAPPACPQAGINCVLCSVRLTVSALVGTKNIRRSNCEIRLTPKPGFACFTSTIFVCNAVSAPLLFRHRSG